MIDTFHFFFFFYEKELLSANYVDVASFDQPFKIWQILGPDLGGLPTTTQDCRFAVGKSSSGMSHVHHPVLLTRSVLSALTSFVKVFGFSRRKQLNKRMTSVSSDPVVDYVAHCYRAFIYVTRMVLDYCWTSRVTGFKWCQTVWINVHRHLIEKEKKSE